MPYPPRDTDPWDVALKGYIDEQDISFALSANAVSATRAPALTRTGVKTANYVAQAGDLVPVNTTSGPVAITLPTAPIDGARVAVKFAVKGGTNVVTVQRGGVTDVFEVVGGATSTQMLQAGDAAIFEYQASTAVWTTVSGLVRADPLGYGDTTFAPKADPVFTVKVTTPIVVVSGGTGAGQGRYMGTLPALGSPPTNVAHAIGDFYIIPDALFLANGGIMFCRVAGNPGGTFEFVPGITTVNNQIVAAINALPELVSSDPAKMALGTAGGLTTADMTGTAPMPIYDEVGLTTGVDLVVATNSVNFVNVLICPVAAATRYEVSAQIFYLADPADDAKIQFQCTAGVPTPTVTFLWGVTGTGVGVANAIATTGIRRHRTLADQEILGGLGVANPANAMVVDVHGRLKTDVGGNFRLMMTQNAASGPPPNQRSLTVLLGSWMALRKLA